MSALQPVDHGSVLGIFCSDLHLSLHPPIWRSSEPNWFEAMLRPINELKALQEKYNCNIFFTGDLFNLWYGSSEKGAAELINFAITHLPYMHCIPGQHDLPDHNRGQIMRTAFYTLVRASVISHLSTPKAFCKRKMIIWPFGFGTKVRPCRTRGKRGEIDICLCHEYHWVPGHCYEGASQETLVGLGAEGTTKKFQNYDVTFCGDNHDAFITRFYTKDVSRFVNCGTMIRRRSNEKGLQPCVWLLYEDKTIESVDLSITKDRFLDVSEEKHKERIQNYDIVRFIKELNKLGLPTLDFVEALRQYFDKHRTPESVQKCLMECVPCQA